jgi:tetraacyldisaccharide 4'-kinase
MKAPAFWQSAHDWRSLMLAPLGWLWCALARRRVLAYRSHRKTAQRLPVPVIVIGNITVGGTGKTPLTLWLAQRLLARGWHPAILSRGHGARVAGDARRVSLDSMTDEVGDEPLMLKRALPEVEVIVHPERYCAGLMALELGADIVVLDDGLQHLQLARDLEICVLDAARGQNKGMGNGRCLPAGPLREPLQRLHEVDAVVLHGAYSEVEKELLAPSPLAGEGRGEGATASHTAQTLTASPPSPQRLRPPRYALPACGRGSENHTTQQWAMRLQPADAVNLVDGSRRALADFIGQECDALAGIGHPDRFFNMLRGLGLTIDAHDFASDHHVFTADELRRFNTRPLLMTAKDAVKCQPLAQANQWHNHWVIPVEAQLDQGFEEFIFSRLEDLRDGQTTT